MRLGVFVTLLAWCSPAFALNPALDISQYAHTSWKTRDGFGTGGIVAIAQTPDGYLWLGTEYGLLRFDGVRAVPWQPPAGQTLPNNWVTSLLVTRDGTLWIGTLKGLISWKGGVVAKYPRLAGMQIATLIDDRRGIVWAAGTDANTGRLCPIDPRAGRVTCSGEDGIFGRSVGPAFEDRAGVLWVGASNGLWRWAPGAPKNYGTPTEPNEVAAVIEDDSRTLLIATLEGLRQVVDGRVEDYPVSRDHGLKSRRLLRDSNGGLWIGTRGAGLTHLHQGQTDVLVRADGLSGDLVNNLFEDREGNIWVATDDGLDRFRDFAVPMVSVKQGLSAEYVSCILPAEDGGMWFGTPRRLARWRSGGGVDHDLDGDIRFLIQDHSHRLWVLTDRVGGLFDHGRLEVVAGVPGGQIRDMTVDRDGDIWMSHQDLGLFRVDSGRGTERIPWSELGHKDFASAVVADPARGGVWLGFYLGGLVYIADGHIRTSYTASDGFGGGEVNDLHFDPAGTLWAATEGGLSRITGRRIATLTSRNGLPCDGVQWMREDDLRATWLNTACGLVRVAPGELDAWAAASAEGRPSDRKISLTVFDASDGVRSRPAVGGYGPKVGKSADGRLWFVGGDGVSVVDPARIPYNRLPPPVRIEQITADRKSYSVSPDNSDSRRLPALIRDLQIDYTALSLVAPEKMRFRYILEGYDRDWQDAGTRRQAFYTNLPPRTYRFRVVASNNSGLWSEPGAALDFSIAPAYYQTTWFPALVIGLTGALFWGAHRVRLRVVEKHEREMTALNERMMKAQEQERIRIAGELHDGVMQQMQSVTMMLGSAKRRVVTNPTEATATIERVQEKLIQAGTDIRQLSHGLHPPILQEAGLAEAVRAYCMEFSGTRGIPVTCDANETVRDLSRGAALAVFRIVQEALGNAAKHANARQIAVRLLRANGIVSLVVSDDGQGFDPTRLGTSGGLGLVMMRERATQLNGTFHFDSAPGRGTTVRVTIPFR